MGRFTYFILQFSSNLFFFFFARYNGGESERLIGNYAICRDPEKVPKLCLYIFVYVSSFNL